MLDQPLLILDLDETLFWARPEKPDSGFDFQVNKYYVTKRPYLDMFLEAVFKWYQVAVWTSSGDDYANSVVSKIFKPSMVLEFLWTSSRCTQRYDQEIQEYYWLKDLKKVKRRGFSLEQVLMIDDSPEKLSRNYGNHLRIGPFEGDLSDQELSDVLPFLDWIRSQDDFRKIEKRNWRNRPLS